MAKEKFLRSMGMTCMVLAGAFMLSTTAEARPLSSLKVGSGSPTGNYYGMSNDIAKFCGEAVAIPMEVENTAGSIDNIDGLANKRFNVGWVQEDVLQYMAKRMPKAVNKQRLKVIYGMHTENLHLLIPKGYKPESKGMFNFDFFGGDKNKALDVNLLKDQKIGSWGGSLVSAKALSYVLDLNMRVVEMDKSNPMPNTPILLVGGQPYQPVANLLKTGKYVLVGLDAKKFEAKAPYYLPAKATYTIGGKLTSVPTVAVQALLIGKSYRSAEKNDTMKQLSACINDSLEDLADDGDTNPLWGEVFTLNQDDSAQTNWAYFE